MITRRPLFASVCGVLAAVVLFALPSASASAAGAKVLLLTRNEEGGTQAFGEEQQWFAPLTGTGKRVAPSAKSCAMTTPVEDGVGVANAEGFNYVVELTS